MSGLATQLVVLATLITQGLTVLAVKMEAVSVEWPIATSVYNVDTLTTVELVSTIGSTDIVL